MGCAVGTCTDPECYMCRIMPLKFPPVERCRKTEGCQLVKDHVARGVPCRTDKRGKKEKADLK